MPTMTLKRKIGSVAAAAAMLGITATSVITTAGPAAADPPQANAFVGVGSDTTQDVLNALSGFNQNSIYAPVFSDSGTPRSTIVSFDAVPPSGVTDGCVTTKVKSPTFARPNGSGSGQRALSRALDGGNFGPNPTAITAQQCAEPGKAISGLVDFARSSSGPSGGAGTVLTFVPFARDALSYGYYRPASAGAPVTTLTSAELTAIYTNTDPVNTPTLVGGVPVIACGIQTSSGTYATWNTDVAATAAQEDVATTACRNLVTSTSDATTGRLQENYGIGLTDKGNALPATGPLAGAQVIIGFSASNFIAQSNGVVTSQIGSADLGAIDALGKPYTGTTTKAPNGTFYASTQYGRDVYNVLSQSKLTGIGNLGIKEIFVSTGATAPGTGQPGRGLPANFTAVMCRTAAQQTVNTFGFLSIANCGATTSTAASRTGTF